MRSRFFRGVAARFATNAVSYSAATILAVLRNSVEDWVNTTSQYNNTLDMRELDLHNAATLEDLLPLLIDIAVLIAEPTLIISGTVLATRLFENRNVFFLPESQHSRLSQGILDLLFNAMSVMMVGEVISAGTGISSSLGLSIAGFTMTGLLTGASMFALSRANRARLYEDAAAARHHQLV